MPDREKVMTWLEICGKNNDCSGCCPYSENGFGEYGRCRESLMADAYDLLKEQDIMMQCIKGKCRICPHCSNCDVDENGLIKEQEAVKPHYNARTNWYECGACHYSMTSGMHCRSELIPATKVRYCANCGFPVNWEGR